MQKSKINSLTKGKILPYSAGSLAGARSNTPGFPDSIPVPGGGTVMGSVMGPRGMGTRGVVHAGHVTCPKREILMADGGYRCHPD